MFYYKTDELTPTIEFLQSWCSATNFVFNGHKFIELCVQFKTGTDPLKILGKSKVDSTGLLGVTTIK